MFSCINTRILKIWHFAKPDILKFMVSNVSKKLSVALNGRDGGMGGRGEGEGRRGGTLIKPNTN